MNAFMNKSSCLYFLLLVTLFLSCSSTSDKDDPTPTSGNKVEGVWMSYKLATNGTANAFDDVKWLVFVDDKNIINGMPKMGFHSITADDLKNYTLGTYIANGTSVKAETPYEKYDFQFTDNNTLTRIGYTYAYHRCVVKDNLKLQGSWTSIANTADPILDQPGVQYVILFDNNGNFTDRGLFVSNTSTPNKYPEDKPGTGTYQIIDYTMILRYADGHIKELSFTGAVGEDPSKKNNILYIGGNPIYKR